jgi:hypothetical protein
VRVNGLEWDCPTEIQVGQATTDVSEGAGTVNVTVKRVGGRKGAVSVDYATVDGTATAGQDYTARSGRLTFADNETTKTISVPVLNDSADEPDETFSLRLSGPSSNATVGAPRETVTVLDDDAPEPQPAGDATPPSFAMSERHERRASRRGVFSFRVRGCGNENARCDGGVTFDIKRGGRRVVVARATFRLSPGGKRTLRVRLTRTGRALLRRRGRLTIRARGRLSDDAENTSRRRSTFVLRAAQARTPAPRFTG